MPTLIVSITGHGFGHARRVYAALREMLRHRENLHLLIRTSAPAFIFADLPRTHVSPPPLPVDFGVLETDAMTIDIPGSIAQVRQMMLRRPEIIAQEVAFFQSTQPDALLADIPYLTGEAVAAYRATGHPLPAIATGNFTWDYMYAHLAPVAPEAAELAHQMRVGYSHFDAFLQMPFGHPTTAFRHITPLPMIANLPRMTRPTALAQLGLRDTGRPRILLGMRGGLPDATIAAAASENPKCDFLVREPIAADVPDNVLLLRVPAAMDFSDLLIACDVCVSKLGYGIAADGAVAGCALLWPRRAHFFEDPLFEPELSRVARHREIPRDDFIAGRWRSHLHALLSQPAAPNRPSFTAATEAAQLYLQALSL